MIKAEKRRTHKKKLSKPYFTLGMLKTPKFNRKSTATGGNIVLQVEKFLEFPTHFHLETSHLESHNCSWKSQYSSNKILKKNTQKA